MRNYRVTNVSYSSHSDHEAKGWGLVAHTTPSTYYFYMNLDRLLTYSIEEYMVVLTSAVRGTTPRSLLSQGVVSTHGPT